MRVLVIEDEARLANNIAQALRERCGFAVDCAENGLDGISMAEFEHYDLLLLDLMLPSLDGLSIVRRVRGKRDQTPILILTARDERTTVVQLLNAGADDYLTKPFGSGELLARIRATTRRIGQQDSGPVFVTGDLTVDLADRVVLLGEKEVQLTPTEYSLLKAFVIHANKLLTHRQLLREVWGGAHYEDPQHLLRVNINNLRRKLEADPARPQYIITEPGVGYRLRTEPRVSGAPSNV